MRIALCVAALAMAGAAQAEVKSTSDSGFRIENRATVSASPEQAWIALGEVGRWWSSEHTYSGDASNMTMPLKVGACFCEALPGGGIEHGRVILVLPEQKMVRLQAALGPLQDEGVEGVMTFQVKPAPGGAEIVQTYNVGGARPETVKNAALIDKVVGEQLNGLRAYLQPAIP